MIRYLCCTLLALTLLGAWSARAADYFVSAVVTVTNTAGIPTNGTGTLTIDGDTRTGTNNIAADPSKLFLGTNSMTRALTNLYNHLQLYKVGSGPSLVSVRTNTTNSLRLTGQQNQSLGVSVAGSWGTVTLSTNYVTNRVEMFSPADTASLETRTNFGRATVEYLERAPLALSETTEAMRNQVGATKTQGISNKTLSASAMRGGEATLLTNFSATNVTMATGEIWHMTLRGVNLSGFITSLTNGTLWSNSLLYAGLLNPTTTNLVNVGNAIRSDGVGAHSYQAGSNAQAIGSQSIAVGNASTANGSFASAIGTGAGATNSESSAFGYLAKATTNGATAVGAFAAAKGSAAAAFGGSAVAEAESATAVGFEAAAFGTQSIALGSGASSTGYRAAALGYIASAFYSNSVAIGSGASATAANQIRLGSATETVSVPGAVEIAGNLNANGKVQFGSITNGLHTGTNTLPSGADLAFEQAVVSSVADGHNVVNVGTNVYVKITGSPSTGWTLGGITGGNRNGKVLIIQNGTGQDVTIHNESGTTPTAADRIRTLAGVGGVTNVTLIGDGAMEFIYDPGLLRWILRSPTPDIIASGTNGVNTISTNGTVVSASATALNIIAGTGINLRATNTSGAVSVQINSSSAVRLFSITNDVTVSNTVAETSLIASALSGSASIPANYLTPGMTIHLFMRGLQHGDGSPVAQTFAVKLGSTLIATNIAAPVASIANEYWTADCVITVRATGASGSVKGQGLFVGPSGAGGSLSNTKHIKLGLTVDAATIDTTSALTFDVTLTPGETFASLIVKEAYATITP